MTDTFDGAVEAFSRRLAGGRSRRSFLGWLGRGAVLVASGSSLVGVLASEAEARVCGQSGVSPKCPTFDCVDAVWGWCWYANGCCAGGRLKKICDCCGVVDNVHGYCPSGTNVKCIVESCGNDPRVQTVAVERVRTDSPAAIAAAFSRARFGRNAKPTVVVSNAAEPVSAAIAATVAAAVGGPLLLTSPGSLDAQTVAEVQRLGAPAVMVVGLGIADAVDQQLRAYGCTVTRPFPLAIDHPGLSTTAATWVKQRTGARRAVCVEDTGLSRQLAPIAGAAAASRKFVLLVGASNATAWANDGRTVLTYMVGPEAASRAGQVAGSKAIRSNDPAVVAAQLAMLFSRVEKVTATSATIAPRHGLIGLAASPGLVTLHQSPGSLGAARPWLFEVRAQVRRLVAVGGSGAIDDAGYYEAQSLLNGFETHLLVGVAGEGLPVIPQPDAERPIGRARTSPLDQPPPAPSYWTERG